MDDAKPADLTPADPGDAPASSGESPAGSGDAPAPIPPAPKESKGKRYPARHSTQFKKELLSRLPQMSEPRPDSSTVLNVFQDMKDISALDADTFLQPLETLAERRHER